MLAHRTIWSAVFFALVLLVRRRLPDLVRAVRAPRRAFILFVAGCLISVNWLGFIAAIQVEKAIEASLGYFIFPLVAVVFGAVFFGERLGRGQMAAVVLAAAAVAVLTLGLGVAQWIALTLAVSFGLYGVIKKRLTLDPIVSVTAEVLLLTPFAIAALWVLYPGGEGWIGQSWSDTLLLMASGPMMATPLILFTVATRRVALATVGLVQYLNPSLQFLIATAIFVEPFTLWHMIAFPMIWAALAIYSFASLRQDRAARSAQKSAGTSATG